MRKRVVAGGCCDTHPSGNSSYAIAVAGRNLFGRNPAATTRCCISVHSLTSLTTYLPMRCLVRLPMHVLQPMQAQPLVQASITPFGFIAHYVQTSGTCMKCHAMHLLAAEVYRLVTCLPKTAHTWQQWLRKRWCAGAHSSRMATPLHRTAAVAIVHISS